MNVARMLDGKSATAHALHAYVVKDIEGKGRHLLLRGVRSLTAAQTLPIIGRA